MRSRDERSRELAVETGAGAAFAPGARLPERVEDGVEIVGSATWRHSLRSLKPEGAIAVASATSGKEPPAELAHVFFRQLPCSAPPSARATSSRGSPLSTESAGSGR